MSKENIEEILKNIGNENVPVDAYKIAQQVSADFSKTLLQTRKQHIFWEHIMRSPITKLAAAAAAIVIIVLGGVTFWPGGSSETGKWWLGPPAVWGQEILATLDTITGVCCREQTVFVMPDGSKHTSSTWDKFYVSRDSYRRDIYDGNTLREIQWYVPDGNDMIQHYVRFDLRCYGAVRHKGSFGDSDPIERMRFYVRLLDDTVKLLGEKVIEGHNCVGFEISASKYGDNPQQWLDRIWFDIDTKFPVLIERERLCPRDKTQADFHPSITIEDQFDYNPQLSSDTFVPYIPDGFINAHPDQIRAGQGRQNQ